MGLHVKRRSLFCDHCRQRVVRSELLFDRRQAATLPYEQGDNRQHARNGEAYDKSADRERRFWQLGGLVKHFLISKPKGSQSPSEQSVPSSGRRERALSHVLCRSRMWKYRLTSEEYQYLC